VLGGAEELVVDAGPGVAGEAAGERAGGEELSAWVMAARVSGSQVALARARAAVDERVVVVVLGAQAGAHAFDEGVVAGEAEVGGRGVGEEGGEEEREVDGWRWVMRERWRRGEGARERSQSCWTGSSGPGVWDMSFGTCSGVVRSR
jgi:hypothetical protein